MRKKNSNHLCAIWTVFQPTLVAMLMLMSSFAWSLGGEHYIGFKPSAGYQLLTNKESGVPIVVDAADEKGVLRAANVFSSDLQKVLGTAGIVKTEVPKQAKSLLLFGTLGQNRFIDDLVSRKLIDVSGVRDQWDGYLIQQVANPFVGVDSALVVVGANKRGTMFGIYDISENMGVSPWYYWADVPIEPRDALYVKTGINRQEIPKVKYRGIFLNDEAPALTNWVQENFGNYNHEFYGKVFELLLRLRANYLWPAMWNNAFGDDDPKNLALAHEYGIVMGTSHHEPMMRADKEWNRYGEGAWDYATNPEKLYEFWQDGAKRNKPFESLYTMGMRGQEDTPMSEGENIELLELIVKDQRKILAEVFGEENVDKVPQVWCLYKEVQAYYEKGMRVPDDVILLWADDNWGNIRRLPTPEERSRSGGAGVYYHFDYVGGPRSYRWINTMPIAKVWQQMNLAYKYGADKIWVVNVGDLKPMEVPTEFFLRMAWDPEEWTHEKMVDYTRLWAERDFGQEFSADIAALITEYTRHNGRRKPELMDPETYSLLNYGEADRIEALLKAQIAKAEDIYKKLPKAKKEAYFQLVLFPVKASATVTLLHIAVAKNRLYAEQGRANAGTFAQIAKQYFEQDAALEREYHALNGGKWNHFMSQPHIGYTNWNNPEGDQMPMTYDYKPGEYAEMGIAVDGYGGGWPGDVGSHWPHKSSYVLAFDYFGKQQRPLTIYNRGTKAFEFKAVASEPWVKLSLIKGPVDIEQRVDVSIDWSVLPEGKHTSKISIRGTGWQGASVTIEAIKPSDKAIKKAKGFLEADGYIAIDAENFAGSKSRSGISWVAVPHLGRTHGAITLLPASDKSFSKPSKAPYVEYPVTFFSSGEVEVQLLLNPSLPFQPEKGARYAVAIGDETPQIIDVTESVAKKGHAWEEMVKDAINAGVSKHLVKKAGPTKIRIYGLDPGLSVQKVIIDTGGLQPSYLGPLQSIKQ